ncbi:MAG: DUF1826 domain-containing protein [Sphingobium sp.]|uniref:DUF1826 domain-containing protein n=1 Tax=Sphingobium sp. TaxID=1912891 RepID=UPI000DB1291D|nr:DUF1826 domain-containing protein [Sphingobium sp.]PZU12326.1 MAG: DUF1826 domain-containing protein [Sphingobium sp.]
MERLVAIAGDRAALDSIARPDAALAIWWRQLPLPIRIALEGLDLQSLADLSVEMDLSGSVLSALRSAGYPEPSATALSPDIDLLVRRHAALTGDDRLHVQLAVVESDPGRRFHADSVSLRLQCTYVGTGTQWCCTDGQDAICEVPTGSVGVFKGRSLLNPPPVLHRPPPSGAPRLVLTIDPVEELNA